MIIRQQEEGKVKSCQLHLFPQNYDFNLTLIQWLFVKKTIYNHNHNGFIEYYDFCGIRVECQVSSAT